MKGLRIRFCIRYQNFDIIFMSDVRLFIGSLMEKYKIANGFTRPRGEVESPSISPRYKFIEK